jgi:flavin reductase (DIM6/NTAB) family NADH-FMN oxidoreductase RutF
MGVKKNIPLHKYNRLINSGCVVLVTSKFRGRINVLTIAWHTPVSKKPPLLAICVAMGHLSCQMIRRSKEFAINVPSSELINAVQFCGTFSGREMDKFERVKITPEPAEQIGAPLIKECIAHIECKVKRIYFEGDHAVFIAQVVNASVDQEFFDGEILLIDNFLSHTLHHLGLNKYIIAKQIRSA